MEISPGKAFGGAIGTVATTLGVVWIFMQVGAWMEAREQADGTAEVHREKRDPEIDELKAISIGQEIRIRSNERQLERFQTFTKNQTQRGETADREFCLNTRDPSGLVWCEKQGFPTGEIR